ncbi:hypothetical protein K4G98_23895, partial [Mycobacterium tuberculosis]|nr:hypothetical protein [Mycobacterium tuberculosis]
DWEEIHKISEQRYQNWEWNYGKSPKFDYEHSKRFPVGSIDIRLNVTKGQITECKIYGDFFGVGDVTDIEEKLEGIRYEKSEIEKALAGINIK